MRVSSRACARVSEYNVVRATKATKATIATKSSITTHTSLSVFIDLLYAATESSIFASGTAQDRDFTQQV